MKKFISLLLVAVMLATALSSTVFATETNTENTENTENNNNNEATAPTQTWAEVGRYDISWAEGLITETATDSQSVVVDEKIYTCKYVNATYEIDTVEKLVGLAVLANAFYPVDDGEGNISYKAIESFSGTTFKLTAAEYDLSEYLWDPIADSWSHKFRGNLISDEGTVIKGMTIRSDVLSQTYCAGLIGHHGNGSIKNITLTGATIEVSSGAVGSFVGYEDFAGAEAVYENLKSDALIKHELPVDETTGLYDLTTEGSHTAWCGVGGILGVHNNTNGGNNLELVSCVFTGSIDAPTSTALGGIVGIDRTGETETITLTKCVVVSDTMRWGVARPAGPKSWYCGMGGIIAVRIGGYLNLNECYVSVKNFIVEDEEQVQYRNEQTPDVVATHEGIGGMVGNHSNLIIFNNCQMDFSSMSGINSHHHGAFVGRQMAQVIFNNCVNTGVWARIAGAGWGNSNTFAWSARAQDLDMDGYVNFSAIHERYGWDYTDQLPTVIESVDTWKDTLNAGVWSEREGSIYPILTIAKSYENYSMANDEADFSFFDMGANSYVGTNEQLKGLSRLIDIQGEYGGDEYLMDTKKAYSKKITINPDLVDADFASFSETSRDLICEKMGFIYGAVQDSSKISIKFAQVALQPNEDIKESKNNTFDIRVVAWISGGDYKNINFMGNRTIDGVSVQYTSPDIKICYKTLIEVVDGEAKEISAGDGYFVCFTIKDVDLKNAKDIKLSFRAYATASDGTIYYSGKYADINIVPFI